MLDRSNILYASGTQHMEPIEIPEWNGSAYVPVLSLNELDELAKVQKKAGNVNALMAVQVIRDDQGNRVFTDDDAPALAAKPGAGKVILRILRKFNEVNGLGDDAAEQATKN